MLYTMYFITIVNKRVTYDSYYDFKALDSTVLFRIMSDNAGGS